MDETEQLRQRVQQLEEEQAKYHAFVATTIHELRTPMAPMKGFIRTLLDDEKEEWYQRAERQEFYGIIEANIDRLNLYLDDLQRGIRTYDPGRMNWEYPVDIRVLAENLVIEEQKQAEQHRFVLDFLPEHIAIETDPARFSWILAYLVRKAIAASPNGGDVWIAVRLESQQERFPEGTILIRIWEERDGDKCAPNATPSQKVHCRYSGDLGKSFVRWSVAAHHGELWEESVEEGTGMTFNIRFPVKQPKSEPTL